MENHNNKESCSCKPIASKEDKKENELSLQENKSTKPDKKKSKPWSVLGDDIYWV
jgi:hypothetical protein